MTEMVKCTFSRTSAYLYYLYTLNTTGMKENGGNGWTTFSCIPYHQMCIARHPSHWRPSIISPSGENGTRTSQLSPGLVLSISEQLRCTSLEKLSKKGTVNRHGNLYL